MADDNKIVLKIQIEKGGSTVTLKNFENQVIKSGVAIKDLNNSIGNFTTSKLKMDGQVKVTTDQFKRLEKSVGGFKTATGASTSATLELGRVLSDMPYGIRGVANNLQQLASNLFFMSKATDTATGKSVGFMGAIGNLFKGLIGPAGILIAFQGIIAAFDYFSNATNGAKKSTDEANVSIGVSATRLKALKDALDNGLMSRKEANEAVDAANKEFKELNLKLDENNKLTDDSVIAINSKIEALINLSKAQALQSLLEKKYSELLPLQAKQLELDTKAKNENAKAIKAISTSYKENGTALAESSAKSSQAAADSNRDAVKLIEKDITDLLKLGGEDGIIDLMFKGKDKKGGGKSKTKLLEFEPFEAAAERYEDELSKLNEQTELLDAKSEVEKLQIKKKYHLARLEAQHTEHKEKYEQTAAEYRADLELFFKQEVARKEMTQEDADKRLAIFDSNTKTQIRQSEESFNVLMDITKSYYNNRITEANFAGQKLIGDGKTQYTREQENLIKHLGRKAELYKSYSDTVKNVLSSIGDFVSAEFERELVVEENRNNEANTLLNNRLLNENLSKDQRADIQNQIAINDEKLRVKKEQIARKQFNVEKAFKIGMAIADTASSALKAYSSQLSPFDLTSPIRALAAAKVATAFGLANVAMIARTKFQSSPSSKPANASIGGGGGGNERSDPSFNIVGRSGENLLINAIQAQFDKPLKAYVVSRDVTNQQQLDGMIVGQAGT